jgi:hypothetical protein
MYIQESIYIRVGKASGSDRKRDLVASRFNSRTEALLRTYIDTVFGSKPHRSDVRVGTQPHSGFPMYTSSYVFPFA